MTRQQKLTMWTIFITSLVHMSGMAISPAMNQMKTIAFPQHSLSAIQTALAMSGIVMPVVSLLSAAAILYGLMTKRSVVAVLTYRRTKAGKKGLTESVCEELSR